MKPLTKQEAKDNGHDVFSYSNGDYSYIVDGTEYLIRNGKEIARGYLINSYSNGDYSYKSNGINGITRKFNNDGKEITI